MFLPGESQGQGSLVGCCLWGRTESDTTEATEQQQQYGFDDVQLKLNSKKRLGHTHTMIKISPQYEFADVESDVSKR